MLLGTTALAQLEEGREGVMQVLVQMPLGTTALAQAEDTEEGRLDMARLVLLLVDKEEVILRGTEELEEEGTVLQVVVGETLTGSETVVVEAVVLSGGLTNTIPSLFNGLGRVLYTSDTSTGKLIV